MKVISFLKTKYYFIICQWRYNLFSLICPQSLILNILYTYNLWLFSFLKYFEFFFNYFHCTWKFHTWNFLLLAIIYMLDFICMCVYMYIYMFTIYIFFEAQSHVAWANLYLPSASLPWRIHILICLCFRYWRAFM